MMAMSNGLHDGFQKTLRFLAGVFSGFLLVISLCAYLNFVLVSFLPMARFWLNLLGTGYMIYLGIHIEFDQICGAGRNQLSLTLSKQGRSCNS